jgi:hypothetical protein
MDMEMLSSAALDVQVTDGPLNPTGTRMSEVRLRKFQNVQAVFVYILLTFFVNVLFYSNITYIELFFEYQAFRVSAAGRRKLSYATLYCLLELGGPEASISYLACALTAAPPIRRYIPAA